MKTHLYEVIVNIALAPNCTARDAEIEPSHLGDHPYSIRARSHHAAKERALDNLHDSIPIGVLDYVDITTRSARC